MAQQMPFMRMALPGETLALPVVVYTGWNMGRERDTHMAAIVHECWGDGEVEVVLSFLDAHGISAATSSLASRSVHPFTVDGMGKISIIVEDADADRARELLAQHEFGASKETAGEEPDA